MQITFDSFLDKPTECNCPPLPVTVECSVIATPDAFATGDSPPQYEVLDMQVFARNKNENPLLLSRNEESRLQSEAIQHYLGV
jgi:hypothetical protein